MMSEQDERLLSELGVSRETRLRLELLVDELKRWQRIKNLISEATLRDVWRRHVADSWQLLRFAPQAGDWLDLGSGGGFPGLVIAIGRTETQAGTTHLVESNGRKCAFLRHVGHRLRLDLRVHQARIEDVLPDWRPTPAVVSARALAPLTQLIGWTQALLRNGAVGIFPKGQDVEEELAQASRYWYFQADAEQSATDRDGRILLVRMTPETGSLAHDHR